MTTKSLLITGIFALGSIGIASAKSYDIRLDGTTAVGATQLKAGQYKVTVNGSQATFTDESDPRTVVTARVRAMDAGSRFSQTMVQIQNQNGVQNLHEIDLGGSSTRLQFGE